MNLRKIAVNFILMLGTIFLCLLIGELLFPYVLTKIPIKLQGYVDRELLTLAQSSKKSIVPNNYIAIVGDSYAAGVGEWLEHEIKTNPYSNPDFASGHILHQELGEDVVSFGSSGVGSILGLVFLILKRTLLPTIISANSSFVVSLVNFSPTILPCLITVTLLVKSIISLSLCVIKIIVLPSSFRDRKILKSSSTSWGVKTPVGSSKINISAFL